MSKNDSYPPPRSHKISFHSKRGAGGFSASSTKLASVRTTSSTFSRKALTVNLTNLTVRVSNLLLKNELSHAACNGEKKRKQNTYAISLFPSTLNSRFTAWGCNSLSTSITCFAIEACSGDANGTSTLLYSHPNAVRLLLQYVPENLSS